MCRATPPDMHVRSWSLRLRPWAGRLHNSEGGPRRANQERVAPRPAQHLDELEAVDRVVWIGADGDRAVALEEDRRSQGLGWFQRFGEGGGDAAGQLGTPRDPER